MKLDVYPDARIGCEIERARNSFAVPRKLTPRDGRSAQRTTGDNQ
jgi:hypothetical protein